MQVHRIIDESFDVNLYILISNEIALIDAGTGDNATETIRKINKVVDIKKIKKIILTHRHYDHVGGVFGIKKIANPEIYMHKDDAHVIEEGNTEESFAFGFFTKFEPLKVNILNDMDEIDVGDKKLKIIHTPGHTTGSICIYESTAKLLFSGDTVFTNGSVGRWDLPTGSYELLLSSMRKLLKLEIKALYPGHGEFVKENGTHHINLGLKLLLSFKE
ncbi:MAG: MBL fold metallo-hydrolase [Candidatus Thermoplasmatota archaeon]